MPKKDETKAARRDRRAAEAVATYAEAARQQAEAAARAARVAEAVAADLESRRERAAKDAAKEQTVEVAAAAGSPGPAPITAPTEAMLAGGGAGGRLGLTLRSVIERMQGTSMCFGEPVEYEGRTVVPVARVRARGGLGFGSDPLGGGGGGGGGLLDGTPVGFIELDAAGSRFVPIPDTSGPARTIRAAAVAAGALAVSFAASRRLLRGGSRRTLPRGPF